VPSEAGQQRHFSSHAEAGRSRQECLNGLTAILAGTYRHTKRQTWHKMSLTVTGKHPGKNEAKKVFTRAQQMKKDKFHQAGV
jgi:hypothetical protein